MLTVWRTVRWKRIWRPVTATASRSVRIAACSGGNLKRHGQGRPGPRRLHEEAGPSAAGDGFEGRKLLYLGTSEPRVATRVGWHDK